MTLSEIRQRAREQTGDQYNLDNEDDELVNGYINEGLFEMLRGRARREGMLRVTRGTASLEGLADFCEGISLTDERGRACAYRVRTGNLYTERDGLYVLLYAGCPDALLKDEDVPEMPEPYQGALSDYAAWRLLSNGGARAQARAAFYFDRFRTAKDALERQWEGRMGARKIARKYC